MPRVNLQVPYRDKEAAKRLGARWDPHARVWFVPEDLDPGLFDRWLVPDESPNLRAGCYFIAASTSRCRSCGSTSPVHAFILPAGHEAADAHDTGDIDYWEQSEEPTLICYVAWLAPEVVARITALTRHFVFAYHAETDSFFWMNLCEYCDAPFDDHETCCEPGEGFLAFTLEDAHRISLLHVDAPFSACCGSYSIGVTLFEEMRLL